jgi:hypothetical protein
MRAKLVKAKAVAVRAQLVELKAVAASCEWLYGYCCFLQQRHQALGRASSTEHQ